MEDKAWAEFKTPLSEQLLLQFCQDVEVLLRINPYLEFLNWEKISDNEFFIHVINHSQKPEFKLKTKIKVTKLNNGMQLRYAKGIKKDTTFIANAIPEGTLLTITESYHSIHKDEYADKLCEVDKSLTKWAEEIQSYLTDWHRWSWFLLWKFYKHHIWLPMKPSARRISYMLVWISCIEIALIALGTIIYFLEYH